VRDEIKEPKNLGREHSMLSLFLSQSIDVASVIGIPSKLVLLPLSLLEQVDDSVTHYVVELDDLRDTIIVSLIYLN